MKIIITFFLLILSSQIFSADVKIAAKNKPKSKIREEMNKISHQIRELGPIIASEIEFTKASNKDNVIKSLTELQLRFKNLKKHPEIELQGLAINQMIMSEVL